jgi:integrase
MSYLKTPRAYRLQGQKVVWCCDGTVNLPDGRRARVVVKRATAREAGAAWQEEATRRIRSIPKSDQPIEQYLDEWLVRRAANVSAKSVERYRGDITRHLSPNLKGTPLDRISRSHLQTLIVRLRESGLRSATVRRAIATLSAAMNDAIAEGAIDRNPCARLKIAPDETPRDYPTVHPRETVALFLAEPDSAVRDLLIFLAAVPLRLNEARGLHRDEIITNGTQANLQASATRTPHPTRKPLKTRSSRRRLNLPVEARDAAQRAAARGVAAGALSEWLFDRGDGLPPSENTIRSTFQRIKRKAGLPKGLRLHDFRRSMATAMGEGHEAVPTIQMALGHSDAATTMKHYAMSTTRIVGDALDRVLQSPAEELSPPNPPPSAENGVDE